MKDTLILAGYLAVIVAVTLIHSIAALGVILVLAATAAGARALRMARRTVLAIIIFNSIVTVAYTVMSLMRGAFDPRYVALINMRVFLLTFLTFLLADTINPFKAFSFSRSLSFLLTLAFSQIMTFRRLLTDFRLAFRSRTLTRPSHRQLYRHGAATGSFFIEKCFRDSAEIAQAMKSRGFFDARN